VVNLLYSSISRHGYDRDTPHELAFLLQLSDSSRARQPIHDWHLKVHQDQADVRCLFPVASPMPASTKDIQSLAAVIGDSHTKPMLLQLFRQDPGIHYVVFDDEDIDCVVVADGMAGIVLVASRVVGESAPGARFIPDGLRTGGIPSSVQVFVVPDDRRD
jgi:hypothetical protein